MKTAISCMIILNGCLHFYCKLIYLEVAGSEIQRTIIVSHQPAMQNIYLLNNMPTQNLNFLKKCTFCKNISDYLIN